MEYNVPRTDAPVSFVSWAGIFTLAAAMQRKVEITDRYFASWACAPNLYVMLVGPPALRKTSTMEAFSEPLLRHVPGMKKGADMFTKESLFQQMSISPNTAMHLVIGEFGDLLQKNGPEIYDFLVSYFDSKDQMSESTRMRGAEVLIRPCLNIVACTTPIWIAKNMDTSVLGGGFASRFMWIFEDKLRAPKLFHHLDKIDHNREKMKDDLIHDLHHMATLKGEFHFPSGREWNSQFPSLEKYGDRSDITLIHDWYVRTSERKEKETNHQMSLYLGRKHVQVLKIAMLHSIACRDDLVLLWEDFEFAIAAVESTEKNLLKVFGGMGRNEYSLDMRAIIGMVLSEERVAHSRIMDTFMTVATPDRLNELIGGCLQTGRIAIITDNPERIYGLGPNWEQ